MLDEKGKNPLCGLTHQGVQIPESNKYCWVTEYLVMVWCEVEGREVFFFFEIGTTPTGKKVTDNGKIKFKLFLLLFFVLFFEKKPMQ